MGNIYSNDTADIKCRTDSSGLVIKSNIKEMIGKPFLFFVHKDDFEKTYNDLLAKTKVTTNKYKNREGEYVYIEWNVKYNKYSTDFRGFDVSDQVNTKLELGLYKTFLDQTEKLIVTGAWNYNIRTKKLILSDGLKEIYETHDEKSIQSIINSCLIEENPYTLTHKIIGGVSGRIKYLKTTGMTVDILGERIVIGISQDITDITIKEKTLQELKEKASKDDNIKLAFIANMSHELRTPLNGIIGITELLKNLDNLSDKQKEYIETLDNSCGVLLSIINNVLDFSKLEKNESNIEISKINIRKFIYESTKLFKFNIEKKNLYFDIEIDELVPEYVETDEVKLKQIIYNLLSNAFKFTSFGGINIYIFVEKDYLNVHIKDTGIGICEEKQKNIFEPFTQADNSTTRKYGGTGLGLSISKSYVKLLKGQITLTSKKGVGSVFMISIPLENIKTKRNTELYKNKKYICIVEDNLSNQYILKEIIESFSKDIVIEYFDNGEECLNNISMEYPPSLIFMDLHMPILDGYECTSRLRENNLSCPIIGISANHMSNEKTKCTKVGMDDFILKPINKNDIHDSLVKYGIL